MTGEGSVLFGVSAVQGINVLKMPENITNLQVQVFTCSLKLRHSKMYNMKIPNFFSIYKGK